MFLWRGLSLMIGLRRGVEIHVIAEQVTQRDGFDVIMIRAPLLLVRERGVERAALVHECVAVPEMIALAQKNAMAVSAGHSFFIFLAEGYYPINILKSVQAVSEVCGIYCATANQTDVIVADNGQGRGILGIVEGEKPKGIESDSDITWRKNFLRQIGYKTA